MASIPIGRVIGGHQATNTTYEPTCHPYETTEAVVLFALSGLGITSNVALILLVCIKKPSKRYHQTWSQGLLLHQGIVDLGRSLLLVYLGVSVLVCEKLSKCFLIDTAFLLLVSVSTVNMLTMLINDAPIFPEHEQLGSISAAVAGAHRLRSAQSWLDVNTQINQNEGAVGASGDSPNCIVFAIFIIWFSCLTIHLGPTFLSGGLTSSDGGWLDVCAIVYKPVRHYVLNVLWILVNIMCAGLMAIHLRKLYRDIVKSNLEAVRLASLVTTMIPLRSESDEANQSNLQGYIQKLEKEGSSRIRMFVVILLAYVLCWGPLFTVILVKPGIKSSFMYEVTVHLAFAHAFVNPLLFLIMYRGLLRNENRGSCCELCYLCFTACCVHSDSLPGPLSSQRPTEMRYSNHCRRVTPGETGMRTVMTTTANNNPLSVLGALSSLSPRVHPRRTVISDTTEMTSFDSSLPPPPPPAALSAREVSQEYEDDPPFESTASERRSVLHRQITNSSQRSQQLQFPMQSSLQTSSPDSLCLPMPVSASSCGPSPHLRHREEHQGMAASLTTTLPHVLHHSRHYLHKQGSSEHHVSTSSSSCKSPHHHVIRPSSSLHRINPSLETQDSVEGVHSLHRSHHHLSEQVDSCEEEDTVRDARGGGGVTSSGGTNKRRIDLKTVSGRLDSSPPSSFLH